MGHGGETRDAGADSGKRRPAGDRRPEIAAAMLAARASASSQEWRD